MPATFDKLLGKPLLHKHAVADITGLSSQIGSSSDVAVTCTSDTYLTPEVINGTNVWLMDASSTPLSVVLPAAGFSQNCKKTLKIKKIDKSTNAVSIIPTNNDTIDGLSETLVIELPDSAVQLVSYESGWFII